MARVLIAHGLILSIFLSGCAAQQELRNNDPDHELARALEPGAKEAPASWLDEHPGIQSGLKYGGIGLLVAGAVVFVGAIVIGGIVAVQILKVV